MLLPNSATAAPKIASINTQSRSDPSWLPQVPAILNSIGFIECEFSTTLRTVKSLTTNDRISAANAIARNSSCPDALARADCIHVILPREAPKIGRTL